MVAVKDALARRVAVVALVASAGGYLLGTARADPVSEPDAALLAVRVDALEQRAAIQDEQITRLQETDDVLFGVLTNVIDSFNAVAVRTTNCLAISKKHYIRGTLDGGKHVRMHLVVWNGRNRGCSIRARFEPIPPITGGRRGLR